MPTAVAGWLYAEDGRSFIGDWLGTNEPIKGDLSLLWMPYAGYQHLIPRLASGLVTALVPPAGWALAVNAIACLVVGSVAGLVFVFSRDVISFLPSRLVLGMLTVMAPMAGLEALGNLANLHWFLLYLTPWLLLATPAIDRRNLGDGRRRIPVGGDRTAVCDLPAAGDLADRDGAAYPAGDGLLAARGGRRRSSPRSMRPGRSGRTVPPIASTIEGYVLNVGMTLGTTHLPLLGAVLVRIGWWVGFVGVAAILAVAARRHRQGIADGQGGDRRPDLRLGGQLDGVVRAGSKPGLLLQRDGRHRSWGSPLLARWGTAASMLLGGHHPGDGGGDGAAVSAVACGLAGAARGAGAGADREPDRAPRAGPARPGRTRSTPRSSTCAATPDGEVELPTPPDASPGDPGWRVDVPCSRLTG